VSTAFPNIPSSEYKALHDVYNATNGSSWEWKANFTLYGNPWVFTNNANPCTERWQGLICGVLPNTPTVSNVIKMVLEAYNLQGRLPASLNQFTQLLYLDLSHNSLTGSLPVTLGQLVQLTTLILSSNFFNETVPNSFGNLSSLQYLDLGTNLLDGPFPLTLTNLTKLKTFYIDTNNFYGEIPSQLGGLSLLENLELHKNSLTGSLPVELFGLQRLAILSLYSNELTGSIPHEFCNLALTLQQFYAEDNALTGSIPGCIGTMSEMVFLALYDNNLNGTLPASLGNLTHLQYLYLYNNEFNGFLPQTIGGCRSLNYFIANNNYFSGPIPESLGLITGLIYVELHVNMFSQTVPVSFGTLEHLTVLSLSYNALTGHVPTLPAVLYRLYIDENYFSGPFPGFLENCLGLNGLDISENLFTGTIPSFIGELVYLRYFNMFLNQFTGTVPNTIGDMYYLQFVFLNSNLLTGQIPGLIGESQYLAQLYMDNNLISGTIPEQLGHRENMQFIDLSNNYIYGSIPASFARLQSIINLLLSTNKLSGNLNDIFDPEVQVFLSSVSLLANRLTGTLPVFLFQLPRLQSVSLINNCFHGTLPEDICACSGLQTIALDGLSSASVCRDAIFPGISKSYLVQKTLTGTIPKCLFTMPHLSTLHLSGNGLAGGLPSDVAISPKLLRLSLSHNSLSGSVPIGFQEKQWDEFDVAYNRFNGELHDSFASAPKTYHFANSTREQSVSLENNRLSGSIPAIFQEWEDVSMLGSNMFSCDLQGSQLPRYDSGRKRYECGSNSFDVPFYFWITMTCCTLILLAAMWWLQSSLSFHDQYKHVHGAIVHMFQWVDVTKGIIFISATASSASIDSAVGSESFCDIGGEIDASSPDIESDYFGSRARRLASNLSSSSSSSSVPKMAVFHHTMALCEAIVKGAVMVVVFSLVVLVPLYVGLKAYYETQTHAYGWVPSAAYLAGKVPTSLILVAVVLLLILILVRFYRKHEVLNKMVVPMYVLKASGILGTVTSTRSWVPFTWRTFCVYTLFIVTNVVVVGGVNAAYVYVAIYGTSNLLFWSQLALSCFKLFWNRFFSIYLIRWTAKFFDNKKQKTIDRSATCAIAPGASSDNSNISNNSSNMHGIADINMSGSADSRGGSQVPSSDAAPRRSSFAVPTIGPQSATAEFASLQVMVALLNNIAIPCLIVAVVSPSCFYNVLVTPPSVTSTYNFDACGSVLSGECVAYIQVKLSEVYDPPFAYSYQCSSSIIAYYAPAFVILCIVRTFATPLAQGLLFYLYKDSTPGTTWYKCLRNAVPPVVLHVDNQTVGSARSMVSPILTNTNTEHNSGIVGYGSSSSASIQEESNSKTASPNFDVLPPVGSVVVDFYRPYFDANQLILSMITYCGILMTFGVMFPPVAVAIVVTMGSVLYYTKLKTGRFICGALDAHRFDVLAVLEEESKQGGFVLPVVENALWMVLTASCLFYTLFLFDMLGDSVGFMGAYWVLIVVPMFPLVLYVVYRVATWWTGKREFGTARRLWRQAIAKWRRRRNYSKSSHSSHSSHGSQSTRHISAKDAETGKKASADTADGVSVDYYSTRAQTNSSLSKNNSSITSNPLQSSLVELRNMSDVSH
jgi:Leucine-rich repeat (LRR) protein